jgi:hypothetical protein
LALFEPTGRLENDGPLAAHRSEERARSGPKWGLS